MNAMYPALKIIFAGQLDAPTMDKALEYSRVLGQNKFDKMIDNLQANYMSKLVVQHGDPNVFNVLVEPKPSVEELEKFGPSGDMVVVDFEMAFVGEFKTIRRLSGHMVVPLTRCGLFRGQVHMARTMAGSLAFRLQPSWLTPHTVIESKLQ